MPFKPAGSSKPTLPVPPVHSPTHSRTSGVPDAPTQAVPAWSRAQPSPHQSDWEHWGLVLMAGSLALLALAAMAMITLALLYRSDWIMPGVQALDVELGGKRKAEAVTLLQQSWLARTVILDGGDTTRSVTPPMLGIMLDAEATAQIAYQQGRSLATLKDVFKAKGLVDIAPVWRIDPTIAEANLQALAPQFDVPPVNAGLQVVDGRVEATPAVSGRALDVTATLAWLEQNEAQVINQGRLKLVMVPVQPAITDTSGVVAQANQLLANPLSIRGYDPISDQTQMWTIGPDVWGAWLTLSVDPDDATRLNWALNTEKARTFLDAQAAVLGSDRYLDVGEATIANTSSGRARLCPALPAITASLTPGFKRRIREWETPSIAVRS
jgi:hypothetical protein